MPPKFGKVIVRAVGISLATWYLVRGVLADHLPSLLVRNPIATALIFTVLVRYADRWWIDPLFYSPFRHLPTIWGSGLDVIIETPRGKSMLKWAKEHPGVDIVRNCDWLGEQGLYPLSPDALRDIMSTSTYDFEKPINARNTLARFIGFGLVLAEGDHHRKSRKALMPAFQIRNIRSLYPLMWEKTNVLLEQLQSGMTAHGRVDMLAWASKFTLDIIGPCALSRDFGSMTNAHQPVAEAFSIIAEPSPQMALFLVLGIIFPQTILRRLPWAVNKIIDRESGYLRDVCRGILREKHEALRAREKSKDIEEETDILSNIIGTGEISDEQVVDEMLTFIAAGHETTAGSLTWCCYLLSRNKTIQEKLRAEIRATVPSSASAVTYDMLETLPYLNGVLEEVLRLFPAVPVTIRGAMRDTVVAGLAIPKDSAFIIPIYAINRNPHFWGPDADEMVPERWIDEGGRANKHGGASSNYCDSTFLHGPRSCIGRDFAKAELRCAIAGVFGRFDVEMVDPNQKITIAGTVTTKPREGMHLKLKALPGW